MLSIVKYRKQYLHRQYVNYFVKTREKASTLFVQEWQATLPPIGWPRWHGCPNVQNFDVYVKVHTNKFKVTLPTHLNVNFLSVFYNMLCIFSLVHFHSKCYLLKLKTISLKWTSYSLNWNELISFAWEEFLPPCFF